MFRRETLIALRARRQAHRVASDVLYPADSRPPTDSLVPAERMDEALRRLDQWAIEEQQKEIARREEDRLISSWIITLGVVIGTLVVFAFAIS
jgi:hypothetical protein